MKACKIIAEVTVSGLVYLGKSPMTGTYICAATVTNPMTTSISPYVCTGIITATKLGEALGSSRASQKVMSSAINNSCGLAVEFAEDSAKFIAFKYEETKTNAGRKLSESKRTYSALNSAEGISWLMRYLSSM